MVKVSYNFTSYNIDGNGNELSKLLPEFNISYI